MGLFLSSWRQHKCPMRGPADTRISMGCSCKEQVIEKHREVNKSPWPRLSLLPVSGKCVHSLEMKMSFFTPIPSGTLSYLCPWGLYPSPQRALKSTAVSKAPRRILAQRPHIILNQQETTLEITGNKILGEGKGVNLGEHYSTCRAGKLAGFNSIFPWLQAYHWGWLLDVAAGDVMMPPCFQHQ